MRPNPDLVRKLLLYSLFSIFTFYTVATIYLHFTYPEKDSYLFDVFTDSYGIIAGVGGMLGLSFYRKWGGLSSLVGRSLIFLSIALLFQFLGQISYALFRYLYGIEIAYPSFGEVFYFGSIPISIYGMWLISVAAGIKVRLRNPVYSILSLLFILAIVAVSIAISYSLFLSNYDFSDPDIVVVLLEIGYPFGQAISVSFTILAFVLSKNILGGKMKSIVILILAALIVQYIADVYYTYDIYRETFYSGGLSDYIYILAYFTMGIALYNLGSVPDKLHKKNLVIKK